jgi:hypothetical protein
MIIEEQTKEEVETEVVLGEEVEENENEAVPETPEETEEETETEPGEPADDEEVIVSFGDEEPEEQEPPKDTAVIKGFREREKKYKKRLKELEAKVQVKTESKPVELGPKPTLKDFDYDSDKFEAAHDAWFAKKIEVDKQAAEAKKQQEEASKQWQNKLDSYNSTKASLKVKDFEDAEFVAQELFSTTQQGIILQGAENPAKLIYALGKNEKKAGELAKIKDPVQFAFAVSKLESQVKTTGRKKPPKPEGKVHGSGGSNSPIDSQLKRLREEAARTGDISKVTAYKKKLRDKNRS